MSRLVSILRAAHCRSTHHYFAIDALAHITTPGGQRLGQMLLKYHDEYLVGAKAPDKSFKDFQNHVLHVRDGNWGGAPKACEKWLAQTIEYLNTRQWKKAAYACGVLSHYFTDPFMPLHTAQSDAEAIVHRPMEWSVCKSYDEILPLTATLAQPNIDLPPGEGWIGRTVINGATQANQHYETLIDNYDLKRGCKQPTEGFDTASRRILAELFLLTMTAWGKVLTRIADETTSDVPECSLTLTTLLATIDMPLAWVVRRISDTYEQAAVKAVLREYEATGTVRRNLPPEIRKVAEARAKAHPQRPLSPAVDRPMEKTEPRATAAPSLADKQNPVDAKPVMPISPAVVTAAPEPITNVAPQMRDTVSPASSKPPGRRSRKAVSRDSDLVDAPSIGPKTARRFDKIGIKTIGQFLDASPDQMQRSLDTRWITSELLREWQDQAKLVCDVPALCGYKVQLLVAANCRSAQELARSVPSDLSGRVQAVCESIDGQRILRSSPPPTASDITEWISAALQQPGQAA